MQKEQDIKEEIKPLTDEGKLGHLKNTPLMHTGIERS